MIVALISIGVLEFGADAGSGHTVAVLLTDAVHVATLVTVTVYTVVAPGLTEILAVVAPVFHKYPAVPPVAVMVIETPLHADGLFTVGTGFAAEVATALAVAVHPAALVTVTLYVAATVTELFAVLVPLLHR